MHLEMNVVATGSFGLGASEQINLSQHYLFTC